MLVIDERFLHQFGVEDLYQVAQHDVRIHNCRFPVVVAPGGVDTGVIVIHEAVPDAADVEKMRLITFDPIHNGYIALGKRVGNAFADGKTLK